MMNTPEDRRLVTVLFVDLVGFTGRAEAEDPESLRSIHQQAAAPAEVRAGLVTAWGSARQGPGVIVTR